MPGSDRLIEAGDLSVSVMRQMCNMTNPCLFILDGANIDRSMMMAATCTLRCIMNYAFMCLCVGGCVGVCVCACVRVCVCACVRAHVDQ